VNSSILIDISQLRVGMYIQLDVGWMHHPFPVSSFRIASAEQIATLRGLGLAEVRYFPKKSDPGLQEIVPAAWNVADMAEPAPAGTQEAGAAQAAAAADPEARRRRELLEAQNRALAACDQRFGAATRQYHALERTVVEHPDQARASGDALVASCVAELLENGDSVIRLLSEGVGERSALHPINVLVISLLLGRALGMQSAELQDLGVAALLHDLGKQGVRDDVLFKPDRLTDLERAEMATHAAHTQNILDRIVYPVALRGVPEYAGGHHEKMDGTGYPRGLKGEEMSIPARVMAIADIFEALTASDRPYKKAKTLSESIKILSFFKKDGHIDGDLFDLFLTSGIYQRYAERFMLPEQIDAVDIQQYLG